MHLSIDMPYADGLRLESNAHCSALALQNPEQLLSQLQVVSEIMARIGLLQAPQ